MERTSRLGKQALVNPSKVRPPSNDLTSRLSSVLRRLELIDWYSRVGQRPDAVDQACVEAHLTALGFADIKIEYVTDINAVINCTKVDYDLEWLAVEEDFRDQLKRSIDPVELDDLNRSLRTVIDPMSERVMQAARKNLPTDQLQILKVAAGCAIEACYQYALEVAVDSKSASVFVSKIRIFEQGRWPLTVANERFHVF